jgi:hypothetical protein
VGAPITRQSPDAIIAYEVYALPGKRSRTGKTGAGELAELRRFTIRDAA